jgi:uncharacterized protein (TIGR03546 family)
MIKPIAKLTVALFDNSDPKDIGLALTISFLLGALPKTNLLWPLLFFIFWFIRWNKGAFFLGLLLFSWLLPLLDLIFDPLGRFVIQLSFLEGFFTSLVNAPVLPLLQLHNTVVMGVLVLMIVLWFPLLWIFTKFADYTKTKLGPAIAKIPFIQKIQKIPLVAKFSSLVSKGYQIFQGDK